MFNLYMTKNVEEIRSFLVKILCFFGDILKLKIYFKKTEKINWDGVSHLFHQNPII